MERTTNYGLIKAYGNEVYDIGQFNSNMDILDAAVAAKADKVTGGTAGNIAVLTNDGGVADGGLKFSIYNGGLRITYDDGE